MRLFFGGHKVVYIIIWKDPEKKKAWQNRQGSVEAEQQKNTQSCYKNILLGIWLWYHYHHSCHHCDLVLS